MESSTPSTVQPKPLAGARATLFLGNHMVTRDMKKQISYTVHAPGMIEYIKQRLEWTAEQEQYKSVNMIGVLDGRRRD